MRKILRDYQQEALDKLKLRLKEADHPLLMTLSVGAGKSVIIAELLIWVRSFGIRSLCLTLNSTLIKQNAETCDFQQGQYGIHCAGLNAKATEDLIIFGSPNSICQSIRNKNEISTKQFGIIVVDECHQISHDISSMYQRIFHHYGLLAQQDQRKLKVVGFTGTPFRDKNESIVGPDKFFKEEVCSISASFLIEKGYLTKPSFGIPESSSFDFKNVRLTNNGKFNQSDLQEVVDNNIRLTGEIMQELQKIDCKGIFIFCSSISHCYEALRSLPKEKSAVIVGSTPIKEREEILVKAQTGEIKYLVSVSILMVGVDIPLYNCCAWLRPTESLILYTQGIGRVLRLHPEKKSALVLDFAQNIQRHGDIDDPIINEALQPREENEKEYCIPCYTCLTQNTPHTRRCIGIVDGKRCDHYFEFKPCDKCGISNDITSRQCRACDAELIDPNSKLNRNNQTITVQIVKGEYWVTAMKGGFPIINCRYYAASGWNYTELFYTNTDKSRNICYAKFIRSHINGPSEYYMKLSDYRIMLGMIEKGVNTPHSIVVIHNPDGAYYYNKNYADCRE